MELVVNFTACCADSGFDRASSFENEVLTSQNEVAGSQHGVLSSEDGVTSPD